VGFIVLADGKLTQPCASEGTNTDCAVKGKEVKGTDDGSGFLTGAYILEMDNSGRIFVSPPFCFFSLIYPSIITVCYY